MPIGNMISQIFDIKLKTVFIFQIRLLATTLNVYDVPTPNLNIYADNATTTLHYHITFYVLYPSYMLSKL